LDGYAASHRAVREMKIDGQLRPDTKVRSSKYLNNLIEQDHRGVKLRIGPMLGFKWFTTAAIVIAGIEMLRRIHQGHSTSAGYTSKIEVRPLSGARYRQRNKISEFGRHADPRF
jgi:transposase-like protein